MKTIPADLADVVRSHAGTERRGQQLRAEADAQDRNAPREGFLDRGDLRS
jgi:hypothetical protein